MTFIAFVLGAACGGLAVAEYVARMLRTARHTP